MKSYENKLEKNTSESSAHRKPASVSLLLDDKRPESILQRKLQELQPSDLGNNVIQGMFRVPQEGIGARVSERNRFNNLTPRQQAMYGMDIEVLGEGRRDRIAEQRANERQEIRERNLWDGSTRPAFTDYTWAFMLANTKSKRRHRDGVMVYKCADGKYYPRKSDSDGNEKFVTIDHKLNWKAYILSNARPEDDGHISKEAAKEAYNDLSNLKLMSNTDNSIKNAPKGIYHLF